MAHRIVIAPAAAGDLRGARTWLTQPGSGRSGHQRWQALRSAPDTLGSHPLRGRPSEHHPDLRELIVSGHRILYRLHPPTADALPATVEIVRVFGPGQAGLMES